MSTSAVSSSSSTPNFHSKYAKQHFKQCAKRRFPQRRSQRFSPESASQPVQLREPQPPRPPTAPARLEPLPIPRKLFAFTARSTASLLLNNSLDPPANHVATGYLP